MKKFWKGKRVLVTGHTGFKGPWLCLWLSSMGAKVTGFALKPSTKPNLYKLLKIDKSIRSTFGDVRDHKAIQKVLKKSKAEIVIHLAAQSLVKESYKCPRKTFETNVLGTVNILEAIRLSKNVKACLIITTDKVYNNKNSKTSFREDSNLGGIDPYSSSKSAVEFITASYRASFFNGGLVATARSGNVIGGGDWAQSRLIPDLIKSIVNNRVAKIRYPQAKRHWIHVLEPLYGYLLLCQKLYTSQNARYARAWNFGPGKKSAISVSVVIQKAFDAWGQGHWRKENVEGPHESKILTINSRNSYQSLGWKSRLSIDETISWTINWYKSWINGQDLKKTTLTQISEYLDLLEKDSSRN